MLRKRGFSAVIGCNDKFESGLKTKAGLKTTDSVPDCDSLF